MSEILKTPIYNTFYRDFINGKKETHEFLPNFKISNWKKLSDLVCGNSIIHPKVKDNLFKTNSDLTSTKSKENLNLLKKNNTVFIVTGQQLGLLASPLYTIYKMITAIKLADKLNSQNTGFNYIPIFWLESEDHDFEEVNHFGVWDKQFNPKIIKYKGSNDGKKSMRHYDFDENIGDVLDELKNELLTTEFSETLFRKLQLLFKPGMSWLESSRELLKDIFENSGILFFQPGHEEIKSLSTTFFSDVLVKGNELENEFIDRSKKLATAGYANQVTVVPGKTFLFFEDDNLQREHLYRDDKGYYLSDPEKRINQEKIDSIIKNNPEKISTNVISRTLFQSWLMPTVAYIAGPGEIAYWAQIGGLFDKMNLTMPVVYPRLSATIVEPKINRFITKNKVNGESLPVKRTDFTNEFLKSGADNFFDSSRISIDRELEILKTKVIEIDSTLENTWQKTKERIINQIDFLENKSVKAKEQKEQVLISQLHQIHNAFFPDENPQERYLTFVYFLNKFGPDIFIRLFENVNLEIHGHQLITI